MKILTPAQHQKENISDNGQRGARELPHWRKTLYAIVALCAAFMAGVLGDYSGVVAPALKALERISLDIPSRYIRGRLADPATMTIDINFKNFQKLAWLRKNALNRGIIVTSDDSYVPAVVTVGTDSKKVRMRLKGDLTDHLIGDKWSLRIRVKGGDTLLGMNRFSIQDPRRSGWINEWLFHRLLKYEGLIGLNYDFINVRINGKDNGIYALEESFGKELTASNDRPEAPILKFDESNLMDTSRVNKGDYRTHTDLFLVSDIVSFHTTKTYQNDDMRRLFLAGRQLLTEFRNGSRSASEVFDTRKAARVFAIVSLLRAHHALLWKNARFYINPVTLRLELVPYNAYMEQENIEVFNASDYTRNAYRDIDKAERRFVALFFTDREFVRMYLEELSRIGSTAYMKEFLDEIGQEFEQKLDIIYRDYPGFAFDENTYYRNAEKAREFVNPKLPVKAYLDTQSDEGNAGIAIKVGNPTRLPIAITGLSCEENGGELKIKGGTLLLPPKADGSNVVYVRLTAENSGPFAGHCLGSVQRDERAMVLNGLKVNYRILGNPLPKLASVDVYPLTVEANSPFYDTSAGSQFKDYIDSGVFRIQPDTNEILVEAGDYSIRNRVVIPPGYLLRVNPGVRLDFLENAFMASYSPVLFEGTAESPVMVGSTDGSGGGIAVINGDGESSLDHVRFTDLTSPQFGNWSLRGAVTFHESAVKVRNTSFRNINAEDALNIVRSEFQINDSDFADTSSDAIDSDFSSGGINGVRFSGCGNDCIDTSGSTISVGDTVIEGAGDKGISVGEKSSVSLTGIRIVDADIAIISKDKSVVAGSDISINRARLGLVVLQKKSEYGPAEMRLHNVEIDEARERFLVEEKSILRIDGVVFSPNGKSLKSYLYADANR